MEDDKEDQEAFLPAGLYAQFILASRRDHRDGPRSLTKYFSLHFGIYFISSSSLSRYHLVAVAKLTYLHGYFLSLRILPRDFERGGNKLVGRRREGGGK